MILNIGCGNDKMQDAVNADLSPLCDPDVVCKLGETLPFKDNEFEEVYCYNVLAHVETNKGFILAINELHRICNGTIHVRTPLATHECAYQDPTEVRRFIPNSFTFMEHEHRRYEQYGKHYGFKPFKVTLVEDNGRQFKIDLCPVK